MLHTFVASHTCMLIANHYLKCSQAGVRIAMIKCVSNLPLRAY